MDQGLVPDLATDCRRLLANTEPQWLLWSVLQTKRTACVESVWGGLAIINWSIFFFYRHHRRWCWAQISIAMQVFHMEMAMWIKKSSYHRLRKRWAQLTYGCYFWKTNSCRICLWMTLVLSDEDMENIQCFVGFFWGGTEREKSYS